MTAALDARHVEFTVEEGVATLRLRRPAQRNAVTREMWEDMIAHLSAARDRADIRVLAVRGTDGVFCAGADLATVKDADGVVSASFHELAVEALTAIADFPVPSVALIEGPCIGGGCSIALACDLRFAQPDATFAVPAVRHGIIYDRPSLARLVELLGPSHAARFMYTAERVDGARAAEIGLVDECGQDLDALFAGFASLVALGDRDTIARTRELLRGALVNRSGETHV